jgi:hypothetical protein
VPDDFRMLAGNITRNTYNASNAADLAPSWECWGDDYGCERYHDRYCVLHSSRLAPALQPAPHTALLD